MRNLRLGYGLVAVGDENSLWDMKAQVIVRCITHSALPGVFINKSLDTPLFESEKWCLTHTQSGLEIINRLTSVDLRCAIPFLARFDWTKSVDELRNDKKVKRVIKRLKEGL